MLFKSFIINLIIVYFRYLQQVLYLFKEHHSPIVRGYTPVNNNLLASRPAFNWLFHFSLLVSGFTIPESGLTLHKIFIHLSIYVLYYFSSILNCVIHLVIGEVLVTVKPVITKLNELSGLGVQTLGELFVRFTFESVHVLFTVEVVFHCNESISLNGVLGLLNHVRLEIIFDTI